MIEDDPLPFSADNFQSRLYRASIVTFIRAVSHLFSSKVSFLLLRDLLVPTCAGRIYELFSLHFAEVNWNFDPFFRAKTKGDSYGLPRLNNIQGRGKRSSSYGYL
jgi:hypothetical protein